MSKTIGSGNKFILIIFLIGVSLLTFMNVHSYKNYTKALSADEYNEVYMQDAEDGIFGSSNANMLLPFKDEQEHMNQAIDNLKKYLKDSSENGNIEKSQEKNVIEKIEHKLANNENLTVNEVESIVETNTGMTGIFSYIFYDTVGKNANLEQYNQYVIDNVEKQGKKHFFYKYTEFFLLYLVMMMIIYVPFRLHDYSSKNYIELYKYRNQLTIKNLSKDILPTIGMIALFITINNIFYFIFAQTEYRDFLYAFIYPYISLVPIIFIISYSVFLNIITQRWFISSVFTAALLLYSNMPMKNGSFVKWIVKPFSILVRYSSSFWGDFYLPYLYENLGLLFIFSLVFIMLASKKMRKINA